MQIIKKKDIARVSYVPWSSEHDIDTSLIKRIELGKTKTKLILEENRDFLYKTAALQIILKDNRIIKYA